jgi:hypothetical protein
MLMNPQHTSAEMVELGGFDLVDELNAPPVAARPKPRGLLPVPLEVEAAVAEDGDQRSGVIRAVHEEGREPGADSDQMDRANSQVLSIR